MSRSAPLSEGHKGASTLELALSAARSGLTTCVIQLLTGRENYGDFIVPDELLTKLIVFPALCHSSSSGNNDMRSKDGLELARLALVCGKYDLVILDGVQNALSVHEGEILRLAGLMTKTRLITIGMSIGRRRMAAFGLPRKQLQGRKLVRQRRPLNNIAMEEI